MTVPTARRRGLLTWWRPAPDGARRLVTTWLRHHDRITSGDVATVTTFSPQSALTPLNRLAADGVVDRGAARGRSAHFTRPSP